jgi:hypothetical protein
MADLWRDFRICETETGQQVAQLHDRYMMMMMMMMINTRTRSLCCTYSAEVIWGDQMEKHVMGAYVACVWEVIRVIQCVRIVNSRRLQFKEFTTKFRGWLENFFFNWQLRDLQSTSLGVLSKCVARGGGGETCKGNLHQGFTLWILGSALYEACRPGSMKWLENKNVIVCNIWRWHSRGLNLAVCCHR